MIASGFEMHFYCDYPGCPNQGQYSAHTQALAIKEAKKAKWQFNKLTDKCFCLVHTYHISTLKCFKQDDA